MNGFTTFDEGVITICSYLGDEDGTKLYSRVARQLMLAINQLNIHLFPNVGVSTIVVEDNLTAALPDDFIAIVKMGVCCERTNELIPIDYNGDLCPKPEDSFSLDCCECEKVLDDEGVIDQEKSTSCSICSISYKNGDRYGTYYYSYLYGASPNFKAKGTYKVDLNNRRIIFGEGCYVQVGSELILEYSSTMSEADYLRIPSSALLALQHRVAFLVLSNPSKREYEDKKFRREFRLLKRLESRLTLKDLVNAMRSGYKSSPKR